MKLYLAGPLFNEAELAQRKYEGKIMRERFPEIELFNPVDQPFNTDKSSLPTPNEIFNNDTKAIIESDIFLADITNNDPGVLVELGIAIATKKHIICVNSDIRLKDASYYEIPTYGFNHYVLGGIYEYGILVNSFEEAMLEVEKYLKKMRQN